MSQIQKGLSPEQLDDRVATLLVAGTGITLTYNDPADSLTIATTVPAYSPEDIMDIVAALIQDGTGLTWTYNDGLDTLTGNVSLSPFTTSDLSEGSNLYFSNERVDDRVNGLLVAGAGINLNYDDGANTLTISSTITQYTNEEAQDAVGTILTNSASIDFDYDDGANQISASVIPGGIDHGGLSGLGSDHHLQYALLAGRGTGQTLIGGLASSNNLTLQSTADSTRGKVVSNDNFEIGSGAASDYTLSFNTSTNDGLLTWARTADQFQFSDDILIASNERLYLRDSAIFLYSNADGEATLEADVLLTLGAAGNTQLGDGTLRTFGPNTTLKIDFGDSAHYFNDCYLGYLFLQAPTASRSQIRMPSGTAISSPAEGDFWNDSSAKSQIQFLNAIKQAYNSTIFGTGSVVKTIANTVTETTLVPASDNVGTLTLPANFFTKGKKISFRAAGIISVTGTPTIRIRIKLGSVTVLDTAATTLITGLSNNQWIAEAEIHCATVGATGTVEAQGYFDYLGATQAKLTFPMSNTATITIDTTASQTIDFTATWGTASSSNTITCRQLGVAVLNNPT